MIDLHCHILPALDDGARDLQDSVAMARQAEREGIEAVCATPHLRSDHAVRVEEIAQRARALQRELARRRVRVRVLPGAEVAETQLERLSEAQLRLASIGGGGRWILLEPAAGPLSASLERDVEQLQARGMDAVLAHPERHAGEDFAERLRALARAGCLIQWTAEFIAQCELQGAVMELARAGLVQLLGSDAHSSRAGRPVALAAGFASLARVRSAAQMEWSMRTAPRAIVAGEPLAAPP